MNIVAFVKRIIMAVFRRVVMVFSACSPIKKNRIVISSYYGKGYGDNPKYIVEELLKKDNRIEIIWLVKDKTEIVSLPQNVKGCIWGSLKAIYYLRTASVWIDNCRKWFAIKRKGQMYIQTWHGFALKRIERDVEDKLSKEYVKCAIRDSKHIDYIISCSSFMTDIYRKAFWYNGEILEFGSPRNDLILKNCANTKEKICSSLSISSDFGIILYAPTFRSDGSLESYSVEYDRLIATCNQKYGKIFIVLVRLHTNILEKCELLAFKDNVINASYYPDVQELLAAADIVISDYSSLMFDFALTGKPCFQFATDIEEYKKDRNFYFRLDELPFALAVDNDGLERNILSFEEKEYKQGLERFYEEVGMVRDGSASRKCAELVIKHCGK